MRYSQLVAKFTLDAIDELMRYAKAVPEDKLIPNVQSKFANRRRL